MHAGFVSCGQRRASGTAFSYWTNSWRGVRGRSRFMSLPGELNALLADLSNPPTCTPALLERIRTLLKGHGKEDAKASGPSGRVPKKDAAKGRPKAPKEVAPFAMRLLNLAGKRPGASPAGEGTETKPDPSLAVVLEAAAVAADFLAQHEKSVGVPAFSIERALLMVATKALEGDLPVVAHRTLRTLCQRLERHVSGNTATSDMDALTAKLKATSISSKAKEATKARTTAPGVSKPGKPSRDVADKAPAMEFKLSAPTGLIASDVATLVLGYYVAVVRLLIVTRTEALRTVAYEALAWSVHLSALDPQAGPKYTDTLFRTLYHADTDIATSPAALQKRELALAFAVENPSLQGSFNELVYKASAATFQSLVSGKKSDPGLVGALLAFFRSMFALLCAKLPEPEYSSALASWTDQYLYLLRKEGHMQEAEPVSRMVLEAVKRTLIGVQNPNVQVAGLSHELDAISDCFEEADNPNVSVGIAMELHQRFRQPLPGDADATLTESTIRKYFRSADRFRRVGAAAIAQSSKDPRRKEALAAAAETALKLCLPLVEWFTTLPVSKGIDSPQLELLLFSTRLAAVQGAAESESPSSATGLRRAWELAKKRGAVDQYPSLSTAMHVLATAAYKERRYREAAALMKDSCAILREAVDKVAVQTSDGEQEALEMHVLLAKRMEMFATCMHLSGDRKDALDILSAGAREYVEHLSLLSSDQSVSQDNTLGDIFERYCKWSLRDEVVDSGYVPLARMMVKEAHGLDGRLYCSLLERELALLQVSFPSSVAAQVLVIDELFPVCTCTRRRSELLLARTRILRRSDPNAAFTSVQQALDLLKSMAETEDHIELLAAAYLLKGSIVCETQGYDPQPFRVAACLWDRLLPEPVDRNSLQDENRGKNSDPKAIVRAAQARKAVKSGGKDKASQAKPVVRQEEKPLPARIENVEQAFADARYAADFLGTQNQLPDRIRLLRICLRINLFRSPDKSLVAESVALECAVGHSYLMLGYTKQAGLAYNRAKLHVESNKTGDPFVDVHFYLGYSYYLSCLGNLDKSKTMFDRAAAVARDSQVFEDLESTGAKAKRMKLRRLLSSALYVQTSLLFAQGRMAPALKSTIKSAQLLIELAVKEARQGSQTKSVLDLKSNSGNAALVASIRHANYETIMELLGCLENLGQMLLIRGSPGEAEVYFRRGLDIAQALGSTSLSEKFALCLAEADYRRLRLEDAESHLNSLRQDVDVPPADLTKDVAFRHMRHGDLCFRKGSLDLAEAEFDKSRAVLEMVAAPAFVAALENAPPPIAATPRETSLLQYAVKASSVGRKVAENAGKGDSFLLSYVKTELLARIGSTVMKQGKLREAEKCMTSTDDQSALDQAEYLVTLGTLRLLKAMQAASGSSVVDSFYDLVFSLPWFSSRPQSATKTSRTKSSGKATAKAPPTSQSGVISAIHEADSILQDAFNVCYAYGFPKLFHDACNGLVTLKMLRAYSSKGKQDWEDLLWETVFYLHKRNGITILREMQSLLWDKVAPERPSERLEWPSSETSPSPPSMSVRQAQLLEVYEREMNMKPSEFRAAYVETLPPHWTVCSLAVDEERDDLIVSRLRKGCDPVIMRLPLRRQAHRDNGSEDCLGYKAALAEFRSILSESDATLQQPPAGMARTDKVDWWNKRKELDGRMGSLVQQIESTWLGAFKSLLLPDSSWSTANSKIFRERLQSVLSKTLDGRTKSKGPMPDIHPAVSDILLRLGAEADDRDVEDFLYFVLESWQAVTGTIDLGEIDMDLLAVDIKDVMEKLLEQCNEDPSVPDEAHVVLIVDRTTNMLPWESLPAFREISMSRLPSLMLLRDLLLLEKQWAGDSIESGNRQSYTVSRTQCSYILNPGGDLASTQKRFETLFAQQQWRGIVGRPPTDSEMCGMLSDSDIFLYFGHNGGEQFVKGHEVRKLDRCAVALLVGCSSGKLKDLGEFEPMGTPVHYLMAGCPTILANLWEVTDKDIDAFAYRVLMDWGMLHEAKEAEQGDRASGAPWPSITACVAASRGECKLKYLNGAAPVVYGVPSYVKRS